MILTKKIVFISMDHPTIIHIEVRCNKAFSGDIFRRETAAPARRGAKAGESVPVSGSLSRAQACLACKQPKVYRPVLPRSPKIPITSVFLPVLCYNI